MELFLFQVLAPKIETTTVKVEIKTENVLENSFEDDGNDDQLAQLLEGLEKAMSSDDEEMDCEAKMNIERLPSKEFEEDRSGDEELSKIDWDEISRETVRVKDEPVEDLDETIAINPDDFNDDNEWSLDYVPPKNDSKNVKNDVTQMDALQCGSGTCDKTQRGEPSFLKRIFEARSACPSGPKKSVEELSSLHKSFGASSVEASKPMKRLPDWLSKPSDVKKKMKKSSLFSL